MQETQFWSDTNWTLIISIILGSAALAYAGDVLGSKYGKRRISMFGLRPKYTSRLITAFTGMFISVVVLAVLSIFSDSVRAALFKMETLRQDLSQATLNLDITRLEMENLRQDRDILESEKNDLEGTVSSLRNEAEDLRRSLDVMRMGAITVQANSMLAQRVILPGSDSSAVEAVLAELEGAAREAVAERRSERLYTVSGDVVLSVSRQEKDAVITIAAGSEERLYVRALAVENTALNETAAVRLESGISYLLYDEGETVHSKLVRPEEPGFNAEDALHVFLRELKYQAINNGVRPDPVTYSVGSLEGEDFFETVDTLKAKDAPVIINAAATQDIYTEGPVRIKIFLE